MRIAILAPEKIEFSSAAASITLGSSAGDDIVLAGEGVAAAHARLSLDARGYVLEVGAAVAPIHVNARPVRERALLHAGDQISIGAAQVLLLGEHVCEACPDDAEPDTEVPPGALSLRGIGGSRSGAALSVAPTLELGADGLPAGLGANAGSLRVFCVQGRPAMLCRDLPMAAWPRINGHVAACAWLHDGDQISIGAQRYLVDAPPDAARHDAVDAFIPAEAARPEDTAGPRREVWWLLLTAAVIALVLALLLAIRH
ncbi:FHA domain-containing protein [Metallibacterium scheffleri]|uniref:YscD cytoplasmic domain-containing protein n=1 Tax=Metallibacterium scheffleri TaxID=993689 RepID=A0A4S3KHC1_9GAMM|nr:FHA domain-containing protein [Metallibacterium scheffleri]THD08097.1 hypothetical protein B1806_13605 [Metallibacterium scheffleri]